jgi:hypothetical protein
MQFLHWLPALVVIAATAVPYAAAPVCGLLGSGMPMHGEMDMPGNRGPGAVIGSPTQSAGHCDFSRCATGPTAPVLAFTSLLPVFPVSQALVLSPVTEPSADPTAPLTPPPQA